MKRRAVAGLLLLVLGVQGSAIARVDPECSTATATSAIAGVVENAEGVPLPGMRVELYVTHSSDPLPNAVQTDAQGFYRLCASGHGTYDVHVEDPSAAPLYASVNQPYTTFTNVTDDADFTGMSGFPLLYTTNLRITPNAFSTAAGAVTVVWVARSKAPADTIMELTLGHESTPRVELMEPDGTEGGGPGQGGWNRWRHQETIVASASDRLNWASVAGRKGSSRTTQIDREPYTFDNTPPRFGAGGPATTTACGGNLGVKGFSPASPPGTTNPMPVVTHGVCDVMVNGARSGLDPFSLEGTMCRDEHLQSGCTEISPVLNATSIVWYPKEPMAYGDYFFQWRIADLAGNVVSNPLGFKLTIADRGGQTPRYSRPLPGNSGGGSHGIIVGSALTTPSSLPEIGITVSDADGQTDMVPGSLVVKVFYGDERALEYEYDPFKGPNDYDPLTGKGGGTFDLSSGHFRATGYSLQNRKPGRYVAGAAITDYGGNTATYTWNWFLVAAV